MDIKTVIDALKTPKKAYKDLHIKLARRANADIIDVGELAERLYNSEQGELLRALINGRKSEEQEIHQMGSVVNADRVLGRLEAYQNIINDLEMMIEQKDRLLQPILE